MWNKGGKKAGLLIRTSVERSLVRQSKEKLAN